MLGVCCELLFSRAAQLSHIPCSFQLLLLMSLARCTADKLHSSEQPAHSQNTGSTSAALRSGSVAVKALIDGYSWSVASWVHNYIDA